ncbi:MAG: hypothetical protein ACOC0P_01765, partial [Planctomycetota bacterium]
MTISRRRFFFQLTPLVDLLLIVVFAQYLGLSDASQIAFELAEREHESVVIAAQAEAFEASLRAEQFAEDHDAATARARSLASNLARLQWDYTLTQRQVQELEQRLAAEAAQAEHLQQLHTEHLRTLSQLAAELLNVPAESLSNALADLPDADRDRVLLELDRLRSDPATTVVHHLRRLNEIHKRADIWEVHLTSDDSVQLTLNNTLVEAGILVESPADFEAVLGRAMQTQPEPKALVLFLLSWSNARWGVIADVQE